jgi:hypothetical protein
MEEVLINVFLLCEVILLFMCVKVEIKKRGNLHLIAFYPSLRLIFILTIFLPMNLLHRRNPRILRPWDRSEINLLVNSHKNGYSLREVGPQN